ncbi:MAG: rRNA cytosine-C5-methyltransferase [Bacteroidaceae bacterium]|nr:rRNA cytosine-C5-methyltransferase [Bacteroidaceae bacterium]
MELSTDFINQMNNLIGTDATARLENAITGTEAVTSIRFNPTKVESLSHLQLEKRVPWSSHGWYLSERPQFTLDPLFHAGCYYVQEASSMFVEHALKQIAADPVCMLDLCAAPGGKSTLAAATLAEGSILVANEIQRSRAQILAENLTKWGKDNTIVTCNTPEQIGASGLQFDIMLTDVPCSGEGMFRKDDIAVKDWSLEAVDMCASRQRDILRSVWPALKAGGLLIYSTCTFNSKEDEDNVEWICTELGADPVNVSYPEGLGIMTAYNGHSIPCFHFLPGFTRGEGFFLAVLRKRAGFNGQVKTSAVHEEKTCREMVDASFDCTLEKDRDSIIAMPRRLAGQMKAISERLYCLTRGIEVATVKGKDYIPSQSLALSGKAGSMFPRAELTADQALDYLHGDVLYLADQPKGYLLVTYMDMPLGFVKNLGNRANNLYPSQWRIRKSVR